MQNPDGSWAEQETTGTGFPKVFYLKYDIYRNAWPLLAFATYRKILERASARREDDINGQPHPGMEGSPDATKDTGHA
jgi:squalene-hopene/tetraprenyl-beta-curcumene cyclase